MKSFTGAVALLATILFSQFAILIGPISVSEAKAQTTVTCTGAGTEIPTAINSVRVDAATRTCTISTSTADFAAIGSMRLTTIPTVNPDGLASIVTTTGGSTQNINEFTTCSYPDGLSAGGGSCNSENNPLTTGTVVIANDQSGTLITLTVTFVAAPTLNSIDVTSASVTFTDPTTGPNASDKSKTVAALQQSFNAATPGLLETFPIDRLRTPSSLSGNTGLSFAPKGVEGFGSGTAFGTISNTSAKSHYGIGFAPDANATGNSSFDFNVNLQQMAAHMARTQSGKTDGVTAYAAEDTPPASPSRWLTSLSGRYVDFDDDQSGADRSGDMWLVTSALGYRLNDKTTAGVLTRYRAGKVESTAAAAELHSTLYGGGAFFSSTGPGGVTLSGAALYEFGTNDITISGDSGSFDSSTVTVEGKIDKRFTSETNKHWLEPAVNVLYLQSDSDDYTDSAGVLVEGQSQTLGRLAFGPKIGTTITATNPGGGQTIYSPYASLKGIWDFAHPDDLTTSSGITFTSAETGLTVAGGVDIAMAEGLNMHISGDWRAFNTKLQVWSLSSGMEASFAALGLGNKIPGLVALNFTGNAEAAQTEAKVKIPLQ